MVTALILAQASCTGSGSGHGDDKLGSLVHGTDTGFRAIDVNRAARDPDELVRAALMTHGQVGEALGPHGFQGKTTITMREGDAPAEERAALEVVTRIELGAGGAFHALSENSREYGREVYFVDDYLYLAPRYSKFHRRRPETPDEPAQIRDDMYGELGAHLELLAPRLKVTDSGEVTYSGRSARAVTLSRADKARRPRSSKGPALQQRAWRRDATVEAVDGRLVIDGETGVVLEAGVSGTVTFTRESRAFSMTFAVEHKIAVTAQPAAITAPQQERWVATPLRSREVDERDILLQGIAPPARKSGPASQKGAH